MSTKKLYILHGWTYTIKPWQKVVDGLRAAGIDVIQLKVPGLTAPSDRVWTIDEYVTWLASSIKDENFTILGHSNGGRIALNFSIKYPKRIKHLILLNSAGTEAREKQLSTKRKVFLFFSKIFKPLKKNVYKLAGSHDYNDAPENMKKTLANMLVSDKNLDLSKVNVKTTILWGKDDKITPINSGRKMHSIVKNSEMKEYEGWGHAPYITHPDELVKAIVDTLEEDF
jgi:pimeloyl-ACP methyl ester carboxylesterase